MCIIRALKTTEKDEMYDLLARSFAKSPELIPASRERQKDAVESDPSFDCELSRVIEVDGKLAARIGIYDRTMSYGDKELRIGAIGGVCTAPEHRGKGFAKKLLEDCTLFMKQNGFDASLLFGKPEIYGKSGWDTLASFGISSNLNLKTVSGAYTRNASMENDVDWLFKIHSSHYPEHPGLFKRSLEYWRKWAKWKVETKQTHSIKIVEDNGYKYGYYVLKPDNKICEMGWDKNIDGSFEKTAAAIFENTEGETKQFSFFMQKLFDFICDNSEAPTLEMMQNKRYYVSKDSIYCGLFKLINGNGASVSSTEDFNKKLRSENYIFWDIDHF